MKGKLSHAKHGNFHVSFMYTFQNVFIFCIILSIFSILYLIIYMEKFLHFDWLRAVQFLGNTVSKKEIQCKKRNSVQISLDVKFLNYLTTHVYL